MAAAQDAARAQDISFTAPYLEIDATYVVTFESQIFSLFPNPGNGLFYLQLPVDGESPVDFSIFDAAGRLVFQRSGTGSELGRIDTGLRPGAYTALVTSGEQRWTRPVIIVQ